MALFVIISLFVAYVSCTNAACTTDPPPGDWCYSGECGQDSDKWSPLCHKGQRQTPIDMPNVVFPTGMFSLRLQNYRGNHFRLTNNGHSVAVDFKGESGNNEGPSSNTFPFPDPLAVTSLDPSRQKIRQYKLDHAHFHWGSNDSLGSEHCITRRCSAMEIHFVHYLADYGSVGEALNSCDEGALAVVGVLFDVSPIAGATGSPLAPIVRHLDDVKNYKMTGSFNEPLDFTQLFANEEIRMFTYKGSLTTPGCNEQVSWFLLRRPVLIPREEMNAFRTKLIDSHHHVMVDNYRELQERNGRDIILSDVFLAQ